MDIRESQPGVFTTSDAVVRATKEVVALLKSKVPTSARKRVRFCAHKSMDDHVHEMIIALGKDTYLQPHRHLGKSESFHVIEGKADVVVFRDDGEIADVIPLGPAGSGRVFFYRIADPLFHVPVVKSNVFIIHETTKGPFVEGQTEYAPWAPREGMVAESEAFMRDLRRRIRARS